jgi:hypothetical protein
MAPEIVAAFAHDLRQEIEENAALLFAGPSLTYWSSRSRAGEAALRMRVESSMAEATGVQTGHYCENSG